MEKVSTQAVMLRKVIDRKKLKPLVLELTRRLERLDEKRLLVENAIDFRKGTAPKTLADKAVIEKTGIERQLEESDDFLSQLILVGNELVTNVKVANEKRELLRRNFESSKREILMNDLESESIEAMARLDEISSKWTELRIIKEPMGLFEQLEEQKKRITELMKQKDDVIKECQSELSRIDEGYYIDQIRQNSDIYCLIERVDNQINLIKNTYNEHLLLLQNTIETERKTLFKKMSNNWQDLYNKQTNHENVKHEKQKEKSKFYDDEIARISREQEEITRATRIRLEKDAEALQLELKKVKNTVIINSEKMDYNYQVLQKRNEENIIVGNQQKRRVGRIMDTINVLKKKIKDTKINSELNIKNMTREILQLQSNIMDLEAKAVRFRALNEKRYNTVWDMNYKEAVELTNKVLDIDRLLYEQQLGLDWQCPNVLVISKRDLSSFKKVPVSRSTTDVTVARSTKLSKVRSGQISQSTCKTDDEKSNENLLRKILIKIADRAEFLCEEHLLDILEPYTESEKTLVRIDNILNALNVTNFDDVKSLTKYFLPYAWCPNCSGGVRIEVTEGEVDEGGSSRGTRQSDGGSIFKTRAELSLAPSVLEREDNEISTSEQNLDSEFETFTEEIDKTVDSLIARPLSAGRKAQGEIKRDALFKSLKFENLKKFPHSDEPTTSQCTNHYLIIEPSLVLTALKEFAEKHLEKHPRITSSSSVSDLKIAPKLILNEEVRKFWYQFKGIISDEKLKLWKCIEHGLKHYLLTLRDREELDRQCEFLRRQNAELKYLLTKYLPEARMETLKSKE